MIKLIRVLLKIIGFALILVGLVAAFYGPLEIFVFYLFSEGGRFHYDGFGVGSIWFAALVVQNIGYYVIAAICIPIGIGHLKLRRWALTLKSPCGPERFVGRAIDLAPGAGVCTIDLAAGATNLMVVADFVPGDEVVDYRVELIDPTLPGSGTLESMSRCRSCRPGTWDSPSAGRPSTTFGYAGPLVWP